MSKVIDLSKTVYEFCKEYPDVSEIPKGAVMKKISLDKLKEVFISKGYQIME